MKHLILAVLLFSACALATVEYQNLIVKGGGGGSAAFQVDSTTQGLLPPRMTEAQRDAIATPADGLFIFNTDTDSLNFRSSAAWGEIGSGGGGGGLNFLSGNDIDAETSIGNWIEYDDGAVGSPVDGLGGTAANITLGRNVVTAEILRGTASFEIVKGAADAQGEGVSIPFSIDQFDQGKEIFVKLKYRNDTNYASGDIKAYIYDVTNATLIGALRNDDDGDFISHTGQGTSYLGAFSAASDSISYRLIFHITSVNALAYDFRFDSVEISPDSVVPGAIITKPVAFTPSFTNFTLGNGTLDQASYWREGSFMMGKVQVTLGSTSSMGTSPTMTIPNAKSLNTAIYSTVDSQSIGAGLIKDTGTANFLPFITISPGSSTEILIRYITSSSGVASITSLAPMTWASTDKFDFVFKIPIQGWSSGAMISTTETLFSTVDVTGDGNGGTVLTANTTNIDFTEVTDPFGAWSGTLFTAPKKGKYSFRGSTEYTGAFSSTLFAYINGVSVKLVGIGTGATRAPFGVEVHLEKNDTLSIRSNGPATLSNISGRHWMSINSLPDFSTFSVFGESEILSSESIVKTPTASGNYSLMTGNSLTLTPGQWELKPSFAFFSNGGPNPAYIRVIAAWFSANGADSGVTPAALSVATGLTINSATNTLAGRADLQSAGDEQGLTTNSVFVTVTQQVTIYLVPFATMTTPANSRISVFPLAQKIK